MILRWVAAWMCAVLLAGAEKVNLNTATKEEIESLPGIGVVYARKIIKARPYQSVADLAKARIPKRTLDQIAPLVTVGPSDAQPAERAAAESPRSDSKSQTVWVNFDSRTYHFSNERWYGKTKNGVFMSEAQAKAQGYRAANGK